MATINLRYDPDYGIAPGESLRKTLQGLEMTQVELAARTGLSQKHLNQIVQGVAALTPDTALLLEKATGVDALMWNGLETRYRAFVSRVEAREELLQDVDWLKELPVNELKRLDKLPGTTDKATLLEAVCEFFRVADRRSWQQVWLKPLAAFRQSTAFAAEPGAVATWLRLGEIAAAELDTEPYDATRFRRNLAEIRELTEWEDVTAAGERMVELCADAGVALVFVAEIGKTRASGAARWLSPSKAMIQLSLRHKKDDHFWFSFFHEAAHLLLHSKKETFIKFVDAPKEANEMEAEANRFAESILIPRQFAPQLDALHTDSDVEAFARQIGIAPGIVVGRLQSDGHWGWNRGHALKRTLVLSED